MSQSQITLPALTNEENTVVDRFVEQSQDIVPGVEVTLAKRILRPGSNRVVCLAARTSVPINDDELASVSDLALRLSDGTNVRLSLSFFNDAVRETINETVSSGAPFNRYTYDTKRYSVRDDSKLGTVLLAMFLIAAAGAYSFTNNPLSKYVQLSKYIPLTKSASSSFVLQPGAPPLKVEESKQDASPQKSAFVGPIQPMVRLAPPVHHTRTSLKAPTERSPRVRERHSIARTRTTAEPRMRNEEMLVPPPPAMPIAPYELPEQFLKQFSELTLPTKPSKTAKLPAKQETKTQPLAKINATAPANIQPISSPKELVKPKAQEVPVQVKKEPAEVVRAKPIEPVEIVRPKPIEQKRSEADYVNENVPMQLERIPAFDMPAHSSAPVPGNVWTSPSAVNPTLDRIERITPSNYR